MMENQTNRFEKAWAEAVVRIWGSSDEAFRRKLVADPKKAFSELGAEIPSGVEVRIIENSPRVVHFVIPPKPAELEGLQDQDLSELYRACPGTVCGCR